MTQETGDSSPSTIWQVAVPTPVRQLFDYRAPPSLRETPAPGTRVRVPFGSRRLCGILVAIAAHTTVPAGQLRTAIEVLDDRPLFSPALFKLLNWAANYYQHPIGEVFATALPARLRQGLPIGESNEVWQAERSIDTVDSLLARAPRQRELLRLLARESGLSRRQIQQRGFDGGLLAQLRKKGLISASTRRESHGDVFAGSSVTVADAPELRLEQQHAVDSILASQGYRCFLLDGVTGSGKTEVYMQVMAAHLRAGRQCLVLVPEIGLTPQTIARFQQRFDCPLATLHSGLNDSEREKAWIMAHEGRAGIVIGTRSAVFTDLARPGLIIIDEEHDGSFKQQDGFRYSARDLAVLRAREEGIPIILGSATPSLESLYNVRAGKFTRIELLERATGAAMTRLKVVDLALTEPDEGLAAESWQAIERHLSAQEQVLIFINRRGFAPLLTCDQCGWIAECTDCVAQMTVHSQPRGLRCHHCGRSAALPAHCPHCASRRLQIHGQGTQRLETVLARRFSTVPVLRIDRDSTRSRRRFDSMLAQIQSGQPCILIGTQMLAKGHHFPAIGLVLVVDADSGLFSADFRAQEHLTQTLVQVSGRAGRTERAGTVLIQSRHATHPVLAQLARLSYREASDLLLLERETSGMPPYSHLALLRAEATDCGIAMDYLLSCAKLLRTGSEMPIPELELLGPMPAPMEKRAGRFRAHLLLKAGDRGTLQRCLSQLVTRLDDLKAPPRLRWSLDVDPIDLI